MKLPIFLQLVSFSAALVVPDVHVFQGLEVKEPSSANTILHKLEHDYDAISARLDSKYERYFQKTKDILDEALDTTADVHIGVEQRLSDYYFAGKEWLASSVRESTHHLGDGMAAGLESFGIEDCSRLSHSKSDYDEAGHGRPDHGGHHHHDNHKPNLTVFELIARSKYTTKLAALISEYDDLVKLLNGTTANFTVFAPTDRAFEKIPKHHPKPSKEQLKRILTYHVSGEFYPAGRVLASRTIPTLYEELSLGNNSQRLATEISFRGLTVNFYSRIIAVDIFGTNGVVHGVDSILVPPPKVVDIINFLPGEFSTLNLALSRTGLDKDFNKTSTRGTLFAPSNSAFGRLGPRVNAFLFSKYGMKYLKALLKYHVVPETILYSDALYNTSSTTSEHRGPPRGLYHVDLPTLLKDRSLSIDIARYGRLIEIKINAFHRVAISDGVAKDGVIHVLSEVLIPPKRIGGTDDRAETEVTVDELCERLQPYIDEFTDGELEDGNFEL